MSYMAFSVGIISLFTPSQRDCDLLTMPSRISTSDWMIRAPIASSRACFRWTRGNKRKPEYNSSDETLFEVELHSDLLTQFIFRHSDSPTLISLAG